MDSGVKYRPPDTHGHPGGGGVVFSNDLGQLRVRSVSVHLYQAKVGLLIDFTFFSVT